MGYDGDAVEATKGVADRLKPYFKVLVADIADAGKDWEDLTKEEIGEVMAFRLWTPLDYNLKKVQEL